MASSVLARARENAIRQGKLITCFECITLINPKQFVAVRCATYGGYWKVVFFHVDCWRRRVERNG